MIRTRVTRDSKINLITIQRWPWGCLLFLYMACSNPVPDSSPGKLEKKKQQSIDSIRSLLQNGDLIFRNGTDEVSKAARSFNRIDTSFSHCGIILLEHDSAFVYHALGGDYNPSQQLRRDPLDSFCLPAGIDRFAIYRYTLRKPESDSLSAIVQHYYAARLPFDLYFNFLSNDRMYCSEFVFKCLDRSLSGELSQSIKARQWPFGISPDDLFLYSRSKLIKRIEWFSNE
jgi:hypothetical protein